MARRRGGYQAPRNPAPVSGPGASSQRTDGAVPKIERSGLGYGENKAVNDQQAAAPMGSPGAGGGGGAAPRPRASLGPEGIFGGTTRPGESMMQGAGQPQGPVLEDNPDMLLQALALKTRHPDLIALVNRRRGVDG